MPGLPAVKGRIFGLAVEDLLKVIASHETSREEVSRRLPANDLEVLHQPIDPTAWYDIRIYARFVELLRDLEGGGSDDYLRARGQRSAEHLLQAGLYQQLEYLSRTQLGKATDPHERYLAFGRDLQLLTTLSGTIYNFSRWQAKPDPLLKDRYRIEVSEATAYPDVMGRVAEGFINRMARSHGEPDLWRYERVRPDLAVFRMIRSL